MKNETKLLNCPFCGGEAELVTHRRGDGQVAYKTKNVVCKKCHAQTEERICDGYYYEYCTDEEAIAAWNTRKPMERILERLEEKAQKAMNNSEKAAELGQAYEKHMIFNGAKGNAFEEAIIIIEEEGGIE